MYQRVLTLHKYWLRFGSYPAGNVLAHTALHEVQRIEVVRRVFPKHVAAGGAFGALSDVKGSQHYTGG